ncbi:palmitoyltransferase ZDHHC8 [Grus japonensis]|uniref:Palmitoyltransferase ZDHHC8 n=1 Tax=Grus japonensis TaxID=30415 RepID=A0ABC9XHV0_GRUJA
MLQRVPQQYGWGCQCLASCVEEPGDPAPEESMEKLCWLPDDQKNQNYRDLPHLRGTELGVRIHNPARSIQRSLQKQPPETVLSALSTCSLTCLISESRVWAFAWR